MKSIPLLLLSAIWMLSCNNPQGPSQSLHPDTASHASVAMPLPADTIHPVGDNSRNALDWAGTYLGVLPCADCPGIETTITLGQEGSYSRTTRYLERDKVAPLTEKGTFTWNKEGSTITLTGVKGGPSQYLVGENKLIQLDMQGKRITGELASRYALQKSAANSSSANTTASAASISGTHWRLTELAGKAIPAPSDSRREIFILLDNATSRVSGSGGCNRIMGSYALGEMDRITFSQMAATRMACRDGMEEEAAVLNMLGEVNHYAINGVNLSLDRNHMAPLARFIAIPDGH